LARTDGVTGEGRSQPAWRWSKTPEELLLARFRAEPAAPVAAPVLAGDTLLVRNGQEMVAFRLSLEGS
jgi:hypothetical protein